MKNLNQLLKLPVLKYDYKDNINFEKQQLEKLFEEIAEYKDEKDDLKKCCEAFDMLQVVLSLIDKFHCDTLDNAWRLNLQKHKDRKIFNINGNYEIFKIMKKPSN